MNFWDSQTLLFCLAMYFFPRVTLLIATPWGGLFWWGGLIFLPRLMVAILATAYYGSTNTVLCLIVWIWAIRGDITEQRRIRIFRRIRSPSFQDHNGRNGNNPSGQGMMRPHKIDKDAIEVDAEIIE